MRLLHILPSYLPAVRYGGPIVSVHGLCKALVRGGHQVEVFTTSVDGAKDSPVPLGRPVDLDGVRVWYFSSPWLRRLYWAPGMGKALRAKIGGFDLVHLHSTYLWPTWAAARIARGEGVPYVLSPRGMLMPDLIRRKNKWVKRAWISLIERRNLEAAAAVHVTSSEEAAGLGGYRLKRIIDIPNGIDVLDDEQRETAKDPGGAPTLLFVGRVHWVKGLDRLIRALAQVPRARLLLAGNDEENYAEVLRRCAAEAGVVDRVEFLGPVHGSAKDRLFREADIVVLASYAESFGMVVVEAMAHGRPVLVTREVGAATAVQHSGAGLVVDGTEDAIARGLSHLLEDREMAERMGAAGRQFVRANYTWERIAQRMAQQYADILAERAAAPEPSPC